jgi:sigma-B regulation protein RsbU (phosphoserine phosphatase)
LRGIEAYVNGAIRRAVAALTLGDDAERHFDLAAKRIQHALLDVTIPPVEGMEIGVHAEPARLVGGDYIDLYRVSGGSLVLAMGDASGKSLAAAMTALMLRYLVRGLLTALGSDDLTTILRHVNTVVSEDLSDGAFITFLLGVYDAPSRALRVVNAGHEPPLVLRAGAQRVESIEAHGIVLGIGPSGHYPEASCHLGAGDLVVLYTDGLTEATNERGELYTIERLTADLLANRHRSAQDLADTMFETVRVHANGELRDDATLLVLRAR